MNNQKLAMEVVAEGIMTDQEFVDRKGYVTLMRNFQVMAVDVMKAIADIRERKLYRPYRTIEEFCIAECGWTRQRFYQIKKFTEVRQALPEKSQKLLSKESHARELSKFPQEQRAEILDEAKRVYSTDGKTPTAKAIGEAGFAVTQVVDKTGQPIPSGDASYHWSRVPEAKRLMALIHEAGIAIKNLDPDDTMYLQCDLQTVLQDLRSAYHRFKGGIPAHVCTVCEGKKPRGCKLCLGVGMLGTWRWDNCGDDEHSRKRKAREGNASTRS